MDLNAELFTGNPFDRVIRISGSGSDTHCENRIVYRVELDNGEVIYHKSRVNTGIRFFNELYLRIGNSLWDTSLHKSYIGERCLCLGERGGL